MREALCRVGGNFPDHALYVTYLNLEYRHTATTGKFKIVDLRIGYNPGSDEDTDAILPPNLCQPSKVTCFVVNTVNVFSFN